MSSSTHLFGTFSKPSRTEWLQLAESELVGKNPTQGLHWQVADIQGNVLPAADDVKGYNQFALQPSGDTIRGARNWVNVPFVQVRDDREANQIALHHLNQGADGVVFDLSGNFHFSLDNLLRSIEWRYGYLGFHVEDSSGLFLAESIKEYASKRNFQAGTLNGFISLKTYPHLPQSLHKVVHNLDAFENITSIEIKVPSASPVQSIAAGLTSINQSILRIGESGLPVQKILRSVFVSIEIGNDFFMEVARLKALRMLWYSLAGAYGLNEGSAPELFIHARSQPFMNSSYTPHENMVKGTLSAMAAIAGGCNALTVHPANYGDKLQQRIACNISNILREECHLNKVADITAGSYYVDYLVHQLAEKAWSMFQLQAWQ